MMLAGNKAIEYLNENSEFFKAKEFMCKCGCNGIKVDTENVDRLNQLRNLMSMPIIITSAYRCPAHNKKVGGVENSEHVQGKATDITVKDFSVHKKELVQFAESLGFTGIGKSYNNFIHVDNGRKRTW